MSLDLERARRFYGLDVTPEILAATRERLTASDHDDLVDAHLAINYGYFGAIDKTLAGFVVLDDDGDDHTLLDLRDGGQIWWQDHETREVTLEYDGLDELLAVRSALDAARDAGEAIDRRVVQQAYRAETPRGSRPVSTAALAARYQWLVWLLAQPLRQNGTPTQTADELVRHAIGRFRHVWPRRDDHEAAFEAELGQLAGDPHLAIYWLLHTTMLADDANRARVAAALGDGGPALVRAFVARFAAIPLAGDLAIVPEFRARRAAAIAYGGFEHTADQAPRELLRALEIDPTTESLARALPVTTALGAGTLDRAEVAAAVARIAEVTTGTALVRAYLDRKAGLTSSDHADALVRLLARSAEESRWWLALEALWQVHELAYDSAALLAVTRAIVARDRYHRRGLQMVMRAASIANESTESLESIEEDLEISDAIQGPYARLVDKPGDLGVILGGTDTTLGLAGAARRGLAWRILQRAEINRPTPEIMSWAAGEVLASGEPGATALVGAALAMLDARTQAQLIAGAERDIDRPDHPLVGVLLAMLEGPERSEGDVRAYIQFERGREAAIKALARWFHDPVVFDRVMTLVERPAGRSVQDPVWSKLFSPFQADTYVVPRLDASQAARCASALIATELHHPQIHARNAAGHALYRYSPLVAEAFLIAALGEVGAKSADQDGPGVTFDHRKTERDQLEAVVANLYSAVRGLGTPASRAALLERLFAERRSFWRMGAALGDAFDPALHRDALAALASRKDLRAAGCYAYTLVEHVKQGAPLVELGRAIVDWEPGPADPALARSFFQFALVVCEKAALDVHDTDLVRRLHAARAQIAEPPIEPDDHGRSQTKPDREPRWKNPLDAGGVASALELALSGAADKDKQALLAAAVAARAAGTPNLAITDAALGQLAGATVVLRLFHDRDTGVIWFRDTDERLHCFDGYVVIPPPFVAQPIGMTGLRELLAGTTRIDERALWWDANRANFREVLRIGDRLLLSWGPNNAGPTRQFVRFPDESAARDAMAACRAHVADGFTAWDPYYLPGTGAIVRTYYVPPADGGVHERESIWVLDDRVCRDDYGNTADAIAEHEHRELVWMRDRDATLTCVEHTGDLRRREDLTVREWLHDRFRDDARDPIWHLEALAELAAYLDAYGLRSEVAELDVQLGTPARDEDIDAFAAECMHPVPDALRALWRAHGRASWKLGGVGRRLLGPREVLARRPAAREAGKAYLRRFPVGQAERMAPVLGRLDVLVETLDGAPVTFVADLAGEWSPTRRKGAHPRGAEGREPADDGRDQRRVFVHAVTDPADLWWDASLSWVLATRMLADLEEALAGSAPILERLTYGQRAERRERSVYLEHTGNFWEAIIDLDTGVAATRFGRVGHTGATTVERMTPEAASAWLDDRAEEKWKQGYRDVVEPAPEQARAKAKAAKPKTVAKAPKKAPKKPATKTTKKAPKAAPKKPAKKPATKPAKQATKAAKPKRATPKAQPAAKRKAPKSR